MRAFCSDESPNHQPEKCLHEDVEIEPPVHHVAKSARRRNRQNDHHACTDRLQEWHAEDAEQRELDEGRRPDAERARQKAVDEAERKPVDNEFLPCKKLAAHMEDAVEELGTIDLHVERKCRQEQHQRRQKAKLLGRHHVRHLRAQECTDDTARAEHRTRLDDDLALAEVADSAREHREEHRRERDAERRMNRHAEADGQERDDDARAARANEADERPQDQHREENHFSSSTSSVSAC